MRVSTNTIKRPAPLTKPFTFTDPHNAECSFTIMLRKLGRMETAAATDIGNEYAIKYVHGIGEKDKPGRIEPEAFPPIDGQAVRLYDSTCQCGAFLYYAQEVTDEEQRYPFEELVSFMTVDAIADQMVAATVWVKFEDDEDEQENPI